MFHLGPLFGQKSARNGKKMEGVRKIFMMFGGGEIFFGFSTNSLHPLPKSKKDQPLSSTQRSFGVNC